MKTMEIGVYKAQIQGFKAFIPHPFPPKDGFDFDQKILKKNNEATRLLGKLDGITKLLPDADFFLLMYLRKDASASSQIEGTRATMIDAIAAEAKIDNNVPDDVDDILHYTKALNYGIKRMEQDNFPMVLRFIRELHAQLMQKARATHFSDPGEFRKSQNWIGGTKPDNAKFVPPPTDEMQRAISDLEKFIHANDNIPTVIKAGLIHSQFETIHPFLDGNKRTSLFSAISFLERNKWSVEFKRKEAVSFTRKAHNEDYTVEQISKWLRDISVKITSDLQTKPSIVSLSGWPSICVFRSMNSQLSAILLSQSSSYCLSPTPISRSLISRFP